MAMLPSFGSEPGPNRCIACGKRISGREQAVRLRGTVRVHRRCATYQLRRRRYGPERLGFPPR
jgi:hypothetical protein